MRFLCDVYISYKLVKYLKDLNIETSHVNEILNKWHTSDKDICSYADENDLIVITKDADFRNSFLMKNTPKKLVKVNLGNISTHDLITVISNSLEAIQTLKFEWRVMIDLGKETATFIKREI